MRAVIVKLYYTFDNIEQFIEINKGQSTIGRSSSATFTIRHDTISKIHTLLVFENSILTIEDTGSSNGTFINGVKITKSEVKPNDNLRIGKVAFRIEMTAAELSAYQAAKGETTTDNDLTPVEGVEAVTDNPGHRSDTFFDLAELKSQSSPPATLDAQAKAVPTALQLILGNRKNLLLITGSFLVLLLMVVVIANLKNQSNATVVTPNTPNIPKSIDKQIKYEQLAKEGIELFLNQPVEAKKKFKEALGLVANNNAISSLVQLCEIWQKGEMNWAKISHLEFRKNLDDIRLEDEGQPGAILYSFVNYMTKLEKFEQENENKYAEVLALLDKFKLEDAKQKIDEISKSSVFFEIAVRKSKQAKLNLIETYKNGIRTARDAGNSQEEVKVIIRLIAMLPVAEQQEYITRKDKLQSSLNKENIWKQANEKLKANDYDEARQLFEMIEQTDTRYYEAVDKLAFIKEENARQNIHVLYDIKGEGKAALKIIADTMSIKFNDLGDKIKKVDFMYNEAIRKGTNDPDDQSAQTLLEQILIVETNPENEYYKRVKNLLAEWKDITQLCNRKYKVAIDKIKGKDYIGARLLCKEIKDLKEDFDTKSVMTSLEKYIASELNSYVRNGKTNEIKKSALLNLSTIVLIGDKDHDTIHEQLLELENPQ